MAGDVRIVRSAEAMQAVAEEVAATLVSGDVLLLYGDLGAGKTTFVQGLARTLGITDRVTSPTFTIVGEYTVTGHAAITTLAHVDLYRLEEETAATDPAVRDVLDRVSDPGRLTVIEWADRLGGGISSRTKRIHFRHGESAQERSVHLG